MASLFRGRPHLGCPSKSTLALIRHFTSTPPTSAPPAKGRLKSMLQDCPRYPYPIKHTFKQSWFGLYEGKHIQFGNNVPDGDYGHPTRRTWKPNVKTKKLYSQALGKFVQVPVVTNVLRTIDKVGGLDEYLLSTKPARLKALGPFGWKLRYKIMQTPKIQKRFELERIRLGLIEPTPEMKMLQKVGRNRPEGLHAGTAQASAVVEGEGRVQAKLKSLRL